MQDLNIVIYDIEIKKGIPPRNGTPVEGIEYCGGWHDHANMGVSTLCAYDYLESRYRVFCDDNRAEWGRLLASRNPLCVGFNNIHFDNRVLRASEQWDAPADDEQSYDLLREIWIASGLPPEFNPKTHGGVGLDAVCEKNFGIKKSGNGALAPVDWQQGRIGNVIDYCLNDILLTKTLFDRAVIENSAIVNPRTGQPIRLRGLA